MKAIIWTKYGPPEVFDIVKHYKGDMRAMLVDCLEALIGYPIQGVKLPRIIIRFNFKIEEKNYN